MYNSDAHRSNIEMNVKQFASMVKSATHVLLRKLRDVAGAAAAPFQTRSAFLKLKKAFFTL